VPSCAAAAVVCRRGAALARLRVLTESVSFKSLCKKHLADSEVAKFRQAIIDDYYFEMMMDELPIWGYVGELETRAKAANVHDANSTRYFLFTHLDFSIAYNGPNIIEVNVSADPLQRVDLAQSGVHDVEFSFSVRWIASDVPYSDRMSRCALLTSCAACAPRRTLRRRSLSAITARAQVRAVLLPAAVV
jgi:hypothetical protein